MTVTTAPNRVSVAPRASGPRLGYRPDIDGLRGIAVLAVVLFHAHVPGFSGGFAGVDIFFVISGFLITSIIKKELQEGSFSLSRFYERRIRRILPALFVVCLASLPFAWIWMLPRDFESFGRSLMATQLFVSNILFWREQSYFGDSAELKPLLHTWSLSVEEQFYIVWPLALYVLIRVRRVLQWSILALIFALSLILAIWGAKNAPTAAFYLTPTRCYELMLGAILALNFSAWSSQLNQRTAEIGSAAGLSLVIGSIILLDETMPFPSSNALFPVVGAALLLLCSWPGTVSHRILVVSPLVGVGLVSYSLYLWHQPVFAFSRIHFAEGIPAATKATLILSCLLLAYLSWRFVEQPARATQRFTRKGVFAAAAVGSLGFVIVGTWADFTQGYPGRHSNPELVGSLGERLAPNVGLERHCATAPPGDGTCRSVSNPHIAIWGDSFAMHLAPALLTAHDSGQIVQYAGPSCGPLIGVAPSIPPTYTETWALGCQRQNEQALRSVTESETIKTVYVSSSLSQYLETGIYLENQLHPPDPDFIASRLIATLDKIAKSGKRPVFVEPPPLNGKNIGVCLARAVWFERPLAVCDFPESESDRFQSEVRDIVAKVQRHHPVVSLRELICPQGTCNVSKDNLLIYRDAAHLSIEGSRLLGEQLSRDGKWLGELRTGGGPPEVHSQSE